MDTLTHGWFHLCSFVLTYSSQGYFKDWNKMFVVRKQLTQQQLINKIYNNRASNYDMHMKWKETAQS